MTPELAALLWLTGELPMVGWALVGFFRALLGLPERIKRKR